ncbi:hypothetical protein GLA29479_2011 [Lysobacter antibioticus]|nr:hypothetical protein GLA29479_2011 [Lysobacter antibioticus]
MQLDNQLTGGYSTPDHDDWIFVCAKLFKLLVITDLGRMKDADRTVAGRARGGPCRRKEVACG